MTGTWAPHAAFRTRPDDTIADKKKTNNILFVIKLLLLYISILYILKLSDYTSVKDYLMESNRISDQDFNTQATYTRKL